jgi:hypothetical protein
MDELTDHGNDPWIYDVDDSALVPDKALLWGLISACKSKYKQDEKQDDTFSKLLSMFKSKIKDKTFVKNLNELTDMYGNTLFHYLVIFGESISKHQHSSSTSLLRISVFSIFFVESTFNISKKSSLVPNSMQSTMSFSKCKWMFISFEDFPKSNLHSMPSFANLCSFSC